MERFGKLPRSMAQRGRRRGHISCADTNLQIRQREPSTRPELWSLPLGGEETLDSQTGGSPIEQHFWPLCWIECSLQPHEGVDADHGQTKRRGQGGNEQEVGPQRDRQETKRACQNGDTL